MTKHDQFLKDSEKHKNEVTKKEDLKRIVEKAIEVKTIVSTLNEAIQTGTIKDIEIWQDILLEETTILIKLIENYG